MVRFFLNKRFNSYYEGGDGGLHVGRAAAVELAVADRRHERVGVPFRERARRHHIGMAGEAEQRLAGAAPRPEVADVAELHWLALESRGGEAPGEHFLAAAILGRDRARAQTLLAGS